MGRFPDEIIAEENTKPFMLSKKWKCSICGELYEFDEEVRIPSPCKECEGIFFEKLN